MAPCHTWHLAVSPTYGTHIIAHMPHLEVRGPIASAICGISDIGTMFPPAMIRADVLQLLKRLSPLPSFLPACLPACLPSFDSS